MTKDISVTRNHKVFYTHGPRWHALLSCTQKAGNRKEPIRNRAQRDLLGGPVVKTLPSNAGGAGLIPGWGTKIPHASKVKKKKRKKQDTATSLTICVSKM